VNVQTSIYFLNVISCDRKEISFLQKKWVWKVVMYICYVPNTQEECGKHEANKQRAQTWVHSALGCRGVMVVMGVMAVT
jgi:hypothetical protein